MISYELALKLKNAGFPWRQIMYRNEHCDCSFSDKDIVAYHRDENDCGYRPSLEELIEACKDANLVIWKSDDNFWCAGIYKTGFGSPEYFHKADTPSESVAQTWLKLNEKK